MVSTPIADVVRHYGDMSAVKIAGTPEAFVKACDAALALARGPRDWMEPVEEMLGARSWDTSFARMAALVAGHRRRSAAEVQPIEAPPVWPLERPRQYDVMIVGAGFAGSRHGGTACSGSPGKRVLVVDRRPHVAGNAYDRLDDAGVLDPPIWAAHLPHQLGRDIRLSVALSLVAPL